MSGGGKGSTTTKQKMDPKALAIINELSDFGKEVARMPYMPWIGNDVAATTPQQNAGMQSFADMGNEFGMGMPTDVSQDMPTATKDPSGAWGYSSHPAYLAAAAAAANENPLGAKRYADFYDMDIKNLFGGADPEVPDTPQDDDKGPNPNSIIGSIAGKGSGSQNDDNNMSSAFSGSGSKGLSS